MKFLNCVPQSIIAAVYFLPDASLGDTTALFDCLGLILRSTRNSLVVGDFNIIKDWSAPVLVCHSGAVGELSNFILDSDLSQLNLCPSRGNNVLDLVLASQSLSSSDVHQMPPFSNCDHKVQVISTNLNKRDDAVLDGVQIQAYQKINFPMLIYSLTANQLEGII